MLAFNLGIFFRNLHGEDVLFSAQGAHAELHFAGGVMGLQEHTDLTRHLAVTLTSGDLTLHLAFEEPEDEEEETDPELALVRVHLMRDEGGEERTLLRTSFQFGEISLKPANEEPPPDEPPKQSAD